MTLYAGHLYWTTDDDSMMAGVWSIAVDGGGRALLAQDDYLAGITAGPGGVYWASISGVATIVDGGRAMFLQGTNPQALASDGTEVYWSNWSGVKAIYGLPFAPPTDDAGAPLYTSNGTEFGLVVYGGNLYWTANDTVVGDGVVAFGPVGGGMGGMGTPIATSQANPLGISVDDSGVYWANNGAASAGAGDPLQAVLVQPSNGQPMVTIASGENHPIRVWADPSDVYVYWVDEGTPDNAYNDGALKRARKDGDGGAQPLAVGQAHPVDIAGDDTCVYWLNAGPEDEAGVSTTGQVMKLVKPASH
jgi:hypothetical protein